MTSLQPQPQTPRPASSVAPRGLVPSSLLAREAANFLKVLLPLTVAAIAIAVVVLGPGLAVLGTIVALLIMLFVGMPMFLAALGTDLDEQRHHHAT